MVLKYDKKLILLMTLAKARLNKEEILYKIRSMRIEGFNKNQIIKAIGMSGETYDNYLNIIYSQDAETLARKREQALATDVELYKNRLEKALRSLNTLFLDNTATAKEKVEIIKASVEIAGKLMRVDSEGTALLELKPELRQMIEDANAMVRNKIEINQYNIHSANALPDKSKTIKLDKKEEENLFG